MRLDIDKENTSKLIIDFKNTLLINWNNYGLKIEDEVLKNNHKVDINNLTVYGISNKQTLKQKIRLMYKIFKLIFFKKRFMEYQTNVETKNKTNV